MRVKFDHTCGKISLEKTGLKQMWIRISVPAIYQWITERLWFAHMWSLS